MTRHRLACRATCAVPRSLILAVLAIIAVFQFAQSVLIPIVLGLLIRVPMQMVVKAVCDHVEDFKAVGELIGD